MANSKFQIKLKSANPINVDTPTTVLKPKLKVPLRKLTSPNVENRLIDLRSYQTKSKFPNKSLVLDWFNQLLTRTQEEISQTSGSERKTHQFRLTGFKKVIDILNKFPGEIVSGPQARQDLGVSEKMAKRIQEILQTGSLSELNKEIDLDPKTLIMNDLLTIHGIGEVNAKNYVEAGIENVQDLKQRVEKGEIKVINSVQIGLKYYDDIQQKIPYDEIYDMGQNMKSCIEEIDPEHQLLVEICGSHRRKKAVSGDIDVLITHQKIRTEDDLIMNKEPYLKSVVKALKEIGFIVADLTSNGNTKFMGVCMHPNVKIGRRIDIRFVAYDSYYPALLYFTGSMTLNKLMRTIALTRGYTLNEYGLYYYKNGTKGEKLLTNSEQRIFEILGIVYLPPEQRDL